MDDNTKIRADSLGRVTLPPGFENSRVIIERVSDNEVRILKVEHSGDGVAGSNDGSAPLTDPARDRFLKLLDAPPKANPALKKAVQSAAKPQAE